MSAEATPTTRAAVASLAAMGYSLSLALIRFNLRVAMLVGLVSAAALSAQEFRDRRPRTGRTFWRGFAIVSAAFFVVELLWGPWVPWGA